MISPTEPLTTAKAEIIRRMPDNFYWAMWDKLDIDPIELDEFLRHWQLSRGELSRLCHCSLHTVNCWFASGEYHRAPTKSLSEKSVTL
jgi:hypothetical protein